MHTMHSKLLHLGRTLLKCIELIILLIMLAQSQIYSSSASPCRRASYYQQSKRKGLKNIIRRERECV